MIARPELVNLLRRNETAVWLRGDADVAVDAEPLRRAELEDAASRLDRFRPALAAAFPEEDWDGRIVSALLPYPDGHDGRAYVKCDHQLPMTGSVKARGGVYEVLCHIEAVGERHGLIEADGDYRALLAPAAREVLGRERIMVASTGNLGFSVGVVARAFGLQVAVHMSRDARAWKKARLRRLGAEVIEHSSDYSGAVAIARHRAAASCAYFVDDEHSRRLFVGYALAAQELAGQIQARGITVSAARKLVVYLPCGVGGAPGGIAAGLKARFGPDVVTVLVEPASAACMLLAMEAGGRAVSVYDYGLCCDTAADGLAVPRASELVLRAAASCIDAVVGLPDHAMADAVGRAWRLAGLRLELSAAASLAAAAPFCRANGGHALDTATHVFWLTGGSLLPDDEWHALLSQAGF